MYRKSGTESLGSRLGNEATVVQSENVFGKLVDQLHKWEQLWPHSQTLLGMRLEQLDFSRLSTVGIFVVLST